MLILGLGVGFVIGALAVLVLMLWYELPRKLKGRDQEWEVKDQQWKHQADAKVAEKNELVFKVIGLMVIEHLRSAIKLVYIERVFESSQNTIALYFKPERGAEDHQRALSHLPMINDLIERNRKTLDFKHRIYGLIKEEDQNANADCG